MPEARDNGVIGKIQTGDVIRLDAINGQLECIDPAVLSRPQRHKDNSGVFGMGRELFFNIRNNVTSSEEGASFI